MPSMYVGMYNLRAPQKRFTPSLKTSYVIFWNKVKEVTLCSQKNLLQRLKHRLINSSEVVKFDTCRINCGQCYKF
jgi:hypothetical protein